MIVYTEVRYDTYVGFISSIHTEQMPHSNIKFTFDDSGKLIDAEYLADNNMAKDEGYWCVICQRFIEADENGLIVHDDIPHNDMTFDEESRPQ